jgi:hypothetical protein
LKFKASWDKQFKRPYFEKYPTQKRASGVAQVVECLPSKHEALSSNPRREQPSQIQLWMFTPIIPAVERQKQEDWEFGARVGYMVKPCLKKKKKELGASGSCL